MIILQLQIYRGMANSSFVVTTSLHNDKATIKAAIANFMKLVRNGETHYLREVIKRWAASELRMDTVYLVGVNAISTKWRMFPFCE